MVESRSRAALFTLLTLTAATAAAQQPEPAAAPPPQAQQPPAPGQQGQLVTLPGPQGQGQVVVVPAGSGGQPQLVTFPTVAQAQLAPPPMPTAVQPPEIMAAEAEAATRRYEAGVDLHTLVAQVAASSGKKFLIDPRVRARIYSVPRLENPTYPELLSVLRLNGYMAVEIGGKVNIMPDANARSMPTRMLQHDDRSVPDDEVVTRVITVPGNNATMLVPILRPLLPQSAHLAALVEGDENKKLIVVDTYANVRRITELVQTLGQ